MHTAKTAPRILASSLLIGFLFLAACSSVLPASPTPTPTDSASPTPGISPTATITRIPTLTPYPTVERLPRRPYATPRYTPATPLPDPLGDFDFSTEVHILALLGSDQVAPFTGRTEAIMLLFYHPRLAQAAVLSLPPDLFVYIPGYTMQRLSTAYAVGGFELFAETIQYNLGVHPDQYLLVNTDTLAEFVDQLGGVEITLLRDYPQACGGVPAGPLTLTSDQVLCYLSFRQGIDEYDRMIRQQEILQALFNQMVSGGNLVRLPGLYNAYRPQVQTNLSAQDAAGAVSLAVKVADPGHLGFFQLAGEDITDWPLSGPLNPIVFLPDAERVRARVQEVIEFVLTPAPFSEQVLTREAQLTASPTPRQTPTAPGEPQPEPTQPPTSPGSGYPEPSTALPTGPGYP